MNKEHITFESAGYKLKGVRSFPDETPAPGVLFYHGLSNTMSDTPLQNQTEDRLQEEGYATFKFDFYGSGESPGELKDKTMGILEENGRDAVEFFYKDDRVEKLGLHARSIGGAVLVLLGNHPAVSCRVTASGSMMPERDFEEKWEELRNKQQQLAKEDESLPGTGDYKGEFTFKEAWFESLQGVDKRIERQMQEIDSILVFATTPDKKVPVDNATKLINHAQEPKRIHIFPGVAHDYAGIRDQVVEKTLEWYEIHLK